MKIQNYEWQSAGLVLNIYYSNFGQHKMMHGLEIGGVIFSQLTELQRNKSSCNKQTNVIEKLVAKGRQNYFDYTEWDSETQISDHPGG